MILRFLCCIIVYMKRLGLFVIPLVFASLLFTSCEDIFHQTSQTLEDIRNDYKIPEPRKIFVGGNFYYNWDGNNREGFAVLNGMGYSEPSFFNSSEKGLSYGIFSNQLGVWDIDITADYVYVGGNFEGYDSNYDGDLLDAGENSRFIQRYFIDGGIDSTYAPMAGAPNDTLIYAIHLTDSNSLMAGGKFTTAWPLAGDFGPVLFDHYGSNLAIVTMTESVDEIYSLEPIFDNSTVALGGMGFFDFGGIPNLNNFVGINIEDIYNPVVIPSGTGGFPPSIPALANTHIRDFVTYENILYVAGTETAMMTPRIYKYEFTDTNVVEHTDFNTTLYNSFISSIYYNMIQVYAVAVDHKGFIYIGGEFYWEDSTNFIHRSILKIRPDGSIDESFKVDLQDNYMYLPAVYSIKIQKNGKILVGGNFDTVNAVNTPEFGTEARGIIRLLEYGAVDDEFDRYALDMGSIIYSIAIEEEPEPTN